MIDYEKFFILLPRPYQQTKTAQESVNQDDSNQRKSCQPQHPFYKKMVPSSCLCREVAMPFVFKLLEILL